MFGFKKKKKKKKKKREEKRRKKKKKRRRENSSNMFWEYSPSSANIASDWLRAKRALLWMRKKYK